MFARHLISRVLQKTCTAVNGVQIWVNIVTFNKPTHSANIYFLQEETKFVRQKIFVRLRPSTYPVAIMPYPTYVMS